MDLDRYSILNSLDISIYP